MSEERDAALRAVVREKLRARRPRQRLSERDARALVRPEVASGAGRFEIDPSELKAIDGLVRFGRGVPEKYRRPDWVGELSKSGAEFDEVVTTMLDRVREDPHENTFRAAQLLLNDLGRTEAGSKYFGTLTQDVVDELMQAQDSARGR